jgi:hypothetical protein
MKATIGIELIGDNYNQSMKLWSKVADQVQEGLGSSVFGGSIRTPWVAEITGFHEKYKFNRKFLNGNKSYKSSNSDGSRGVYIWYILESGRIYEIKKYISWKKSERYFVKISSGGDLVKVTEEAVTKWLKQA